MNPPAPGVQPAATPASTSSDRSAWATMAQTARGRPLLWRLIAVRMASQLSDGIVQAALAGVVLFAPEHQTRPLAIVGAFAVLTLPYSLLGPFAAAALDTWDRRGVLLWAGLARCLLTLLLAVGLLLGWAAHGGGNAVLLVLALALFGAGRFLTAGTSASLPHVAPGDILVALNSALATSGAVVTGVGAVVSLGVYALLGGDAAAAGAVIVAAVIAGLGALAAAGFRRRSLGPQEGTAATASTQAGEATVAASHPWRRGLVALSGGLRGGVRAAGRAPRVGDALIGLGTHRFVFGINTLILVLALRSDRASEEAGVAGIGGFTLIIAAITVGMLAAAVTTPWLLQRLSVRVVVVAGLVILGVVQFALVAPLFGPLLPVAGVLLGCASQIVKLSGDAAMLLDVPSASRGQVFGLQDATFNIPFVLGMALVIPWVPLDGQARSVLLAGGGCYLLAATVAALRRPRVWNDGGAAAR